MLEHLHIRYKVVADSGFASNRRVLRPARLEELTNVGNAQNRAALQEASTVISAIRESSEWAINSLKKLFAQLGLLPSQDDLLRLTIIQCCLHLHNVRVREMEMGQVRRVYEYLEVLD